MIHRIKKHTLSVKHAIEGIFFIAKNESNFQIHIAISIIVIFLGLILQVSNLEWILLIFVITVGLVIEGLNTVVEELCDIIDTTWRQDIKIVKDVAAGSMLIYAVGATLIAFLIFVPKLIV